ncbi:MAG: hypothetical protein KAY37_13250, partial [Phycisphaerae bacterium]|nr:hypothetical protein [Phycisphaerae bacterium]
DGDGLSDGDEVEAGTDPLKADTDGDGLSDSEEADLGTDPLVSDTDGDGLSDGDEVEAGTDPLKADTDGDGLTDSEEADLGTDPLVSDTDGDGLSDGDEVQRATDPLDPDTDDDGLDDGAEVAVWGTDPLDHDTDGDFLWDGTEVALLLDPLEPNPTGFVDEVYCTEFVAILGMPAPLDMSVYENTSILTSFLLWNSGDFIARDIDAGRLVNITLGTETTGIWRGLRSVLWGDTWLWDRAVNGSWIETADGMIWYVHVSDWPEVLDWLLLDDLTLVQPTADGWWRIINVDTCEVVRAQ